MTVADIMACSCEALAIIQLCEAAAWAIQRILRARKHHRGRAPFGSGTAGIHEALASHEGGR